MEVDYTFPKCPIPYAMHVEKILPLIKTIEDKDIIQVIRIRKRLQELAQTLPSKKRPLVYSVCHFINRISKSKSDKFSSQESDPKRHKLSDHALCRALERVYGWDMNSIKDHVLVDVMNNEKFECIGNTDVIMTVMKKHFGRNE